jgi:Pyruvate/2-oxoacid:ferredoxin oxidoreductase delta subunit
MQTCPSGALELVPTLLDIRMGLAVVDHNVCFRTAPLAEDQEQSDCQRDCQACVTQCPVGDKAIHVNEAGAIEVLASGCTGCGVCEWVCPTTPQAIVIRPLP